MPRRKRPVLGAACPTSAQNIRAKDRQVDAVTLRRQGWTYPAIAEELGIAKSTAIASVKRALEEVNAECKEEAEGLRALEQMRLDGLYLKSLESLVRADEIAIALKERILQGRLNDAGTLRAWAQAEGVIHGAVRECRGVSERRSKLCGLDSAEKIEHGGEIKIDDARTTLLARLNALSEEGS
ncbi:MAG: hypothetical protein WC541_07545 [Dehalococcoidia bacterium]